MCATECNIGHARVLAFDKPTDHLRTIDAVTAEAKTGITNERSRRAWHVLLLHATSCQVSDRLLVRMSLGAERFHSGETSVVNRATSARIVVNWRVLPIRVQRWCVLLEMYGMGRTNTIMNTMGEPGFCGRQH